MHFFFFVTGLFFLFGNGSISSLFSGNAVLICSLTLYIVGSVNIALAIGYLRKKVGLLVQEKSEKTCLMYEEQMNSIKDLLVKTGESGKSLMAIYSAIGEKADCLAKLCDAELVNLENQFGESNKQLKELAEVSNDIAESQKKQLAELITKSTEICKQLKTIEAVPSELQTIFDEIEKHIEKMCNEIKKQNRNLEETIEENNEELGNYIKRQFDQLVDDNRNLIDSLEGNVSTLSEQYKASEMRMDSIVSIMTQMSKEDLKVLKEIMSDVQ